MSSVTLVTVRGTLKLCRDMFGNPIIDPVTSWCGSTDLSACSDYMERGKCCALIVGNHALWIKGCGAKWISKNISADDIIRMISSYNNFTVESIRIKTIRYGSKVEAGWGAVVGDNGAEIKIYADGFKAADIAVQFPPVNVDRTFAQDLDATLTSSLSVEVDQHIRAYSGYVIQYVHDIELDIEAKIYVPSSEIQYGSLEFDVQDVNGNPISGALIKVIGNREYSKTTDENGVAVFDNLIVGQQYRYEITKSGYKRVVGDIVLDKQYKVVTITMQKSKYGPSIGDILKWIAVAGSIAAGALVGYKVIGGERRRK